MESDRTVRIKNWGSRENVYDTHLPEMGLCRASSENLVWMKEYISANYRVIDKQKFLLAVIQHGIEFMVMEKCV